MSISSRKTLPVSRETRPNVVSRTARGCSKISLSMKCLKPPFSAMMGSHVMCWTWRVMGWPSKSVNCTPAGVIADGGHIAGNEIFIITEPNHCRRTVAPSDDLVRLFRIDYGDSEDASQLLDGLAHRFFQRDLVISVRQGFLDEMGDDFGVSLGAERVSTFHELLLQDHVVFNNAIVHNHDLSGAVAVGMGVLFRGTSVRGPAGVPDAVGSIERL